jgi:hypothetical protein
MRRSRVRGLHLVTAEKSASIWDKSNIAIRKLPPSNLCEQVLMSFDWYAEYGLSRDPFSVHPVPYKEPGQMERLLVRTESIKLIEGRTEAFFPTEKIAFLITGKRGVGKSTILHHMCRRLLNKSILPIYIRLRDPAALENLERLSNSFNFYLVFDTLDSVRYALSVAFPSMVDQFEKDTKALAQRAGAVYEPIQLIQSELLIRTYFAPFFKAFRSVAVIFDELDKARIDVAQEFLRGLQGFLEKLFDEYRLRVFMAGSESWTSFVRMGEFSGLFDETIQLGAWTRDDAYQLIYKRLQNAALGEFDMAKIAEKEAIYKIFELSDSMPRNTMRNCEAVLRLALQYKKRPPIDAKFCETMLRHHLEDQGNGLISGLENTDPMAFDAYQKLKPVLRENASFHFLITALYQSGGILTPELLSGLPSDMTSGSNLVNYVKALERHQIIKSVERPMPSGRAAMVYPFYTDVKRLLDHIDRNSSFGLANFLKYSSA